MSFSKRILNLVFLYIVLNFSSIKTQGDEVFTIDYFITKREVMFEITQDNSCYVKIVDKVTYSKPYKEQLIEHLLLRNNVTHIIPINVYTDKPNSGIDTFSFSEELMVYNVNFLPSNDTERNEFNIFYEYYAYGFFKENENSTKNLFDFKFLNENSDVNEHQIYINLDFYFSNSLSNKDIIKLTSYPNFSKDINENYNKTHSKVRISYDLNLKPQELHVLEGEISQKMFYTCGFTFFEYLQSYFWILFIFAFLIYIIYSRNKVDEPKKLKFDDIS
jgi:hypothetical protein